MRKILIILALIFMAAGNVLSRPADSYQDSFLIGNWKGVIQVGGAKFTFLFKFTSDVQNEIKGFLDLPEQDEHEIPIDEIKIVGKSVSLDISKIQRKFEGEISIDQKKITGFYIRGGGMRLPLTLEKTDLVFSMNRPQLPQPPYPYKEEPVVVVNGKDQTKLAGTLTLPEGAGAFPAIIFISGSGAQDRDESMFGHKPFLVMADYFARRGAAVLRCDDRGAGKSGGSHFAATTAIMATDIGSMWEYLLTRAEIDQKKIFLLGHSEGAVIACLVASQNPRVAGVILLGAPGLSIEENLYLQNSLIRKAEGASDEMIAQANVLQRKIFSVVKDAADNAEAQAKLREIFSLKMYEHLNDSQKKAVDERIAPLLSPYFRDIIKCDPAGYLSKVTCPVFAIIGEKDLQCPPKENIPALEKTLRTSGNQSFQIIEMEGLNHLLQRAPSGAMSEYASIEETISPRALAAISDWLFSAKKKSIRPIASR